MKQAALTKSGRTLKSQSETIMSKKPQDQPERPKQPKAGKGRREPPKNDQTPRGSHSPTPCEDAEWAERMDELEVEREELLEEQSAQPATVDLHELTSIVTRLEALRATSQEYGEQMTQLNAHLDEALSHLHHAVSDLAEQRAK
jgi:hypothetical protein